jgi:AraC-like DNA-binding protein
MTFWIMVAGAAQGFFLAALLAGRARHGAAANRILSLLVGLISIRLAEAAVATRLGYGFIPGAIQVTFPIIFAFAPLLYFYVEARGRPDFGFRRWDCLHFLPCAMATIWVIAALWTRAPLGLDSELEAWAVDLPWFIQAVVYSTLILLRHPDAMNRVLDTDASPERANIRWIGFLTLTFLGIAALVAFRLLALLAGMHYAPGLRGILYAAVALLIYLWGYRGLSQAEIFFPTDASRLPGREAGPDEDAGRISVLQVKILGFMEAEKPFLDPELSLHGLAARLHEPPHLISQMINREFNSNFFTFVNGYRVEEAKRRLAEPESRRIKLLALALDCGFASKSSFNRVFKEMAGMTPSEFQRLPRK